MAVCDLTYDVTSAPLSPDDHLPLMQMKYSARILEEDKYFSKFFGLDYFSPEVSPLEITGDLKMAQSLRVRFKKHVSPFDMVQVSDVAYKAGETCPPVLDVACEPGCISTTDSWETKDILFDKKYQVGASWCIETERLTYGDLEQKFRDSLKAQAQVFAVHSWTKLICDAIANPVNTVGPDATCFPTNIIDGGLAAANGLDTLTQVLAHIKGMYSGIGDYVVLAHRYFETDILSSGSSLHNYNNTGIPTAWANEDSLIQGGFKPMPALPTGLWNEKILIAPDMVDFYAGAQNLNPFMNEDGSKYYVVIVAKDAYYTGLTNLMDMTRFPATCDNKYESIQQTWLSFGDILRPGGVWVISFDVNC